MMKLLFTHEIRAVSAGGRYYNSEGVIGYANLLNYLHRLGEGLLVLRYQGNAGTAQENWLPVDGPGVTVAPIPNVRSLLQALRRFPKIYRAVVAASKQADRYVVRLPGICGTAVALSLLIRGHRYGVEFVGHPTDSFVEMLSKQNKRRPLLVWLIDWLNTFLLRRSVAVAYRSRYLQQLYPSGRSDREVVFSGAQIHPNFITGHRPKSFFMQRPYRIVSIGRIMPEKGHMVLLEAFALATRLSHVPMLLRIVGDGDSLPGIRQRAYDLGISDKCEFMGRVPWGVSLFATLDDAHLFVLPSLTEGMPRSLIEAMTRGMPAIGSRCGGIPELLDPEQLVPPGEIEPLARRIAAFSDDPEKMVELSRRNFEASVEHWPDNLNRAKDRFWDLVVRYAK